MVSKPLGLINPLLPPKPLGQSSFTSQFLSLTILQSLLSSEIQEEDNKPKLSETDFYSNFPMQISSDNNPQELMFTPQGFRQVSANSKLIKSTTPTQPTPLPTAETVTFNSAKLSNSENESEQIEKLSDKIYRKLRQHFESKRGGYGYRSPHRLF